MSQVPRLRTNVFTVAGLFRICTRFPCFLIPNAIQLAELSHDNTMPIPQSTKETLDKFRLLYYYQIWNQWRWLMHKDIYDILFNPIRMRIMQTLVLNGRESITANEICTLLSDIPRTTLYRHINVLIEADLLHIVAERKIRGSVERTLSLNVGELKKLSEIEDGPAQAFRFLMMTYAKFETYFKDKPRKSFASAEGTLFLRNAVMMLNDEEFQSFLADMQAVFEAYIFEGPSEGRKLRDISIISAPPEPSTGKDDPA